MALNVIQGLISNCVQKIQVAITMSLLCDLRVGILSHYCILHFQKHDPAKALNYSVDKYEFSSKISTHMLQTSQTYFNKMSPQQQYDAWVYTIDLCCELWLSSAWPNCMQVWMDIIRQWLWTLQWKPMLDWLKRSMWPSQTPTSWREPFTRGLQSTARWEAGYLQT